MKVALFPGQGIPLPVILESLHGAPELLARAKQATGADLLEALSGYEGSSEIAPTSLTQPAVFLASMHGWIETDETDAYEYAAGHSLGEYAALCAAGSLSLEDALAVLDARAQAMQLVSEQTPGGMAAILKLDIERVREIAIASGLAVANDNAPGQVVLSGPVEGLAMAERKVAEAGGGYVRLEIVGPFHSPAVAPAVPVLRERLDKTEVKMPSMTVVSNVTARPFSSPTEIRDGLVQNLTTGVRWRESMEWLFAQGVRGFKDIGPGQVLHKLTKRIFGGLERAEKAGVR